MKSISSLRLIPALLVMAFALPSLADSSVESLRYLPVQDAGRLKPYDTLARETLQLVYGSQKYKSPQGTRRPAIEVVTTWMLVPDYWDSQKIIEVAHHGLKESLKLPTDQKHFSPAEMLGNQRFPLVLQELNSFRQTKEKLTPFFQAAQRLESQLGLYQAFRTGHAIRVLPPAAGASTGADSPMSEPERWASVAELTGEAQAKFGTIVRSFVQSLPSETGANEPKPDTTGAPPIEVAVADWLSFARAQNPELYPTEQIMALEIHDADLHPFQVAWILYLLGAILLGVAWQSDRALFYKLGWVSVVLGFLMHTYGFGLRVYLTGRPPVSNMYETVIWVSWGAILFAAIFEAMYRRKYVLLSGAAVGVLCLIVADLAPTVLDPSLQPLEPVLRSNLWLTVHVLVITLSYSAFFLAWGLGNVGLGFILRGDKPTSERVRGTVQALYRATQIGVVLLAAGTILGGVWADYSWGRFWGWDPKETWALIALLGYLAMLHGRLIGLLQNFGMLVSSVVAFNLVIMAWYGVNYVLGAGLHSYGFGAGGIQYVGSFVAFNLIYAGYVAYVKSQRVPVATAKPTTPRQASGE